MDGMMRRAIRFHQALEDWTAWCKMLGVDSAVMSDMMNFAHERAQRSPNPTSEVMPEILDGFKAEVMMGTDAACAADKIKRKWAL